MPKNNDPIPDYGVFDFSGGVRTDKGNAQLKDNEVAFANNVEFLPGKMFKRAGSRFFGGFKTAYPVSTETFETGIFVPKTVNQFFMVNRNTSGQGGMAYRLYTAEVATAVAAGATTIVAVSNVLASFPASGTVEIEGDLITYTSISTNNTLNVTGSTVTSGHPVGALIRCWVPCLSTGRNTNGGVGFAYLNAQLFNSGSGYGLYIWDGTNLDGTAVTGPLNPNSGLAEAVLYPTTYKQRIYGVSDGVRNRIDFSEVNDPTVWSGGTTGNFNIEDGFAESVVGLRDYRGHLIIFQQNATWYYNLSVLAQINSQIGAYNHKCHTEINGQLLVFGPKGAYMMTGRYFQMRDIGQPVKKWLEAFNAGLTTNANNASYPGDFPNCARYNNKWLIYIGDVTLDQQSYSDVVLVYDTVYRYWTVWSGFTNLQGWINTIGLPAPGYPNNAVFDTNNKLFYMDDTQGIWEMFDEKFASSTVSSPPSLLGDSFRADRFKNTGNAISSEVVTKTYQLKTVGWWKRFGYLRIYAENWPLDVEVRPLIQTGYGEWQSLGQVRGPESILKIASQKGAIEGYGLQLRFSESSQNDPWSILGFIFEDTVLLSQLHR